MTSNPDRSLRTLAGMAGIAAVAALLAIVAPAAVARADAADARARLARALAELRAGNATSARTHAQATVRMDPQWGLAQAVLARSHLALGEGLAAEAALDRATTAGFDPRRAFQMRAHARLLQGDTRAAIAAADRAPPRFRGYAMRIKARALAEDGDMLAAVRLLDRVVADAPGDAEAWTDLGRLRMDAGDMSGAITASATAVAADPHAIEALRLRGQTVRAQYGLVAALPWFEAALRLDPWHHDTLIDYAATLGDAGRTRAMLAAVRRAAEARPSSPQAFYLQAVLAARAGAFDLARGILQRTGGALDEVPGALLLGGVLDIAGGAHAQAATKLNALMLRQPTNVTARKLLATALLGSDAAPDALAVLRPAALRSDADSETLLLAARAFERTGDRAAAATLIDRAAIPATGTSRAFAPDDTLAVLAERHRAAPTDPASAIPYIRALADTGRADQAVAVARVLVDANRGAPAAWLALGDAQAAAGRSGAAADTYLAAADVRFDEPTLLRLLDALDRAGRRQKAAEALALFLDQNPQNLSARRLAARWQLAAGDFAAAADTLEVLRSQLGNRDAALLAELAQAWTGTGDAVRGTVYGAAAYRLAPGNPASADAYGWALYRSGNAGAAAPLVAKAAQAAPRHPGIRWHLAQVAADTGRRDAAIANARTAIATPGFANRREAEALIAALSG